MNKNQEGDHKKVISLKQHREQLESDPEIENLLLTMRKMREDVSVNYQLKEQLRERFTGASAPPINPVMTNFQKEAGKMEKKVRRFQWALFLIPFILIITGIFYYLSEDDQITNMEQPFQQVEREIFYDSLGSKGFSIAIGTDGTNYFIYRGALWTMKSNGQNPQEILKPDDGELFREVTLSSDKKQLALIAESGGKPQILLFETTGLDRKVLWAGEQEETFKNPVFSPAGGQIAFTKVSKKQEENIVEEIYILPQSSPNQKPQFLTLGSYPSWSPDGKQLAIERTNPEGSREIWIVTSDGDGEQLWGTGAQPQWSKKDYLAYVAERNWEKVLSYDSQGNPLLTSKQKVQEIWVADLAGKVKANLTKLPGPDLEDENKLLRQWQIKGEGKSVIWELGSSTEDNHPRWSPDGKFLIVERNYRNHSSLVWVKTGGIQ